MNKKLKKTLGYSILIGIFVGFITVSVVSANHPIWYVPVILAAFASVGGIVIFAINLIES